MTRSSPPARRSAAGRARPRTTAARSSTASPRCWRAARASSSTRSPTPRACPSRRPPAVVDAAIDRWVWYAGWTDKIAQVVGGANPVAGPYFNLSTPEPTGVVTVLAPQESSFLGLVSVIAPVIATGNTVVVDREREVPAPGPVPGRGAGHLRPARRRRQRPLRPYGGDRGPARRPPGRQRDRPGRRGRRAGEGAGDRGGRQPQARPASTACGRLVGRPRAPTA